MYMSIIPYPPNISKISWHCHLQDMSDIALQCRMLLELLIVNCSHSWSSFCCACEQRMLKRQIEDAYMLTCFFQLHVLETLTFLKTPENLRQPPSWVRCTPESWAWAPFSGRNPRKTGKLERKKLRKARLKAHAQAASPEERARHGRQIRKEWRIWRKDTDGKFTNKQRIKAKDARGWLVGGNGLAFVVNTVSMIKWI